MYHDESTVRELLADELVAGYLDLVFPKFFLDYVPEKHRDRPLSELPDVLKMPWGAPYISDAVLDAVKRLYELKNDAGIRCVPLWKETVSADFFPEPVNAKEGACLFVYADTFRDNRPAAIVVPGGAYTSVAIAGEGMDTADSLREKGYAVAVLKYRCLPNLYPAPQADLSLAVKYIRANAGRLGVNGDDLLVVGYSAGGHLAASQTVYADEIEKTVMEELQKEAPSLYERYRGISAKADKVCLSYAFTGDRDNANCMDSLVGHQKARIDELIVFRHVDSSFPKCFLWACEDDPVVDIGNTTKMAQALWEKGVPCMMQLYPTGGHGIGTAAGMSAEGWIGEMLSYLQ